MKRTKVVSCGALPWRLNAGNIEVLLIKQFKHRDSWGLAKGHIHDGETLEQCAIRECREETGIDVTLHDKLMPVVTTYGTEEKTVYSWLASPLGDNVPNANDPDCEIAEVRWWNVDTLPVVHPYQQPLVQQAIELLKIRQHAV